MRFLIGMLFTGEDPLYHDRAVRYLKIAEKAAEKKAERNTPQYRDVLKRVLTFAITSRKDSKDWEERALAWNLWSRAQSVYPGLLDLEEPNR